MKHRLALSFLISILFSFSVNAQIYNGVTGSPTTLDELYPKLGPGTILIVSEMHGHVPHHQNQRDLLVKLSPAKFPISVGMEFFSFTEQAAVDDYVEGRLDEDKFLEIMEWGKGIAFGNYRFQVRFPFYRGGNTVALNLPRKLTGKVSQDGLEALNEYEKSLIPKNFTLGNQQYFERFKEVMGDHIPKEKIQNYFVAQSLWDESMASKALEHQSAHPDDLLMIIVGDFHVAFGGGLPDRLKARGAKDVVTISQVLERDDVKSHPLYGPRADFVWVAP